MRGSADQENDGFPCTSTSPGSRHENDPITRSGNQRQAWVGWLLPDRAADELLPYHPAPRPKRGQVGTRETFGHWEADLLIFRKEHGKANVTSLVERKSRFTFLLPNQDKRPAAVIAGIADALRPLPEDARRTVTFDRGSEFAAYAALDRELAVTSYFCDPHSPWQKGAVENANGRVRRFLPREAEPGALTPTPLRRLADRLNDTPRRCLGYRTPREVFEQHLAAPTGPP